MTKEEIIEMARKSDFEIHPDNLISFDGIDCTSELIAFAKLIAEKAIKEALAQPEQEPVAWEQFYPDIGKPKFVAQPEQEPVAWLYERDTQGICTEFSFSRFDTEGRKGWNETPLYTTPPQNTWAGLTDRDINELWISLHDDFGNPPSATGYGRAIETKLKDKNTRGQE